MRTIFRSTPASLWMLVALWSAISTSTSTSAFSIRPSPSSILAKSRGETTTHVSVTALFAKAKRGRLSSIMDAGKSVPQKTRGKAKKNKGGAETISPALAQWASQSPTSTSLVEDGAVATESEVASFEDFAKTTTKKKKSQNTQKSFRQQAQVERDEKVATLVEQLTDVVNSKAKQKDLNDLLDPIRQLVTLSSATEQFRSLAVGSKQTNNYRLAWVGSDDAVSHVGTGLHKVPLARLQEVFVSLPGRNRVQLLEVIRIIGPFPNVKNVLQGDSATKKTSTSDGENGYEVVEWNITWDSMMDGTGKELLAGKEENIQKVLLHVYFCTEEAMVAVIPPNSEEPSERRQDIFENGGANILVFVKEDNLDDKLEVLRVA